MREGGDGKDFSYHDQTVSTVIEAPFPCDVQDPGGVGLGQEIGRVARDDGEEDVVGEVVFEEMRYWCSVLSVRLQWVLAYTLHIHIYMMTPPVASQLEGQGKRLERTRNSAYTTPSACPGIRGSP